MCIRDRAGDARLANLLALIAGKQDGQGRWPLEYAYGSKTWGSYGRKGQPNKWVTLRALRVLGGNFHTQSRPVEDNAQLV